MKNNQRIENWSQYWLTSDNSSCVQGIDNEGSDIRTFWKEVADCLEDSSNILDVYTGKGAVIFTLVDYQIKKNVGLSNYVGIDISNISPNIDEKLKNKIVFTNQTSVYQMPFSDNDFDFITSQFGLEYDLNVKAGNEIKRVLKPHGKLYAVMHAQDSILASVAKEENEHLDFLFDEINGLGILESLVPYYVLLKNPANVAKLNNNKDALERRNNFNQMVNELEMLAQKSIAPNLIKNCLEIFHSILNEAKNNGKKATLLKILKLKQSLKDNYARNAELVEASYDLKTIENFCKEIKANKHQVKELFSNNRKVAWGLILEF